MYNSVNMKKVVIWLFGIMIVSFLIAGSIFKAEGGFKAMMFGPQQKLSQSDINEEKVFNVSGIKELEAHSVSSDIKVIPVDSDEVKVHFYGYASGSSNRPVPELIAEARGSKLFIQIKHKPVIGFNFGSERLNLDIYVPKKYTGDIRTETVSGSTLIDGFTLNRLSCNSVSGDINIGSTNTERASAGSTSGSIEVSSMNTNELKINTTSGEGRIRDFSGKLDFGSVSGSLNAEFSKLTGDIKLSTVSGEANLKIPENSEFSVDFGTVSGDFKTDFAMVTKETQGKKDFKGTVGNGTYKIEFNSTSGSFQINK